MDARTALSTMARRAAVSVVAGLLVSAFAAAALVLGTAGSSDRLAVGRTIWSSLAPVSAAVTGAGLVAGLVVFTCLVANDVLRRAGPWLVAQRGWVLGPLHAVAWILATIALAAVVALQAVVRSAVVADVVRLVRTVGRPVVLALGYAAVVALCATVYAGMIAIGVASVAESTGLVVALLEDPPRPLAMAIGIGGATVVMYVGFAAFALCGWLAHRASRRLRRAARGLGTVAP